MIYPKKSKELLSKGANFQNDNGYLTSSLTDNFNFPEIAPQKYSLVLDPKVIDDNSYKYRFYDTTDNRMKFAKIYSLFSHFKNGLVFKSDNDVVKNNKVMIQLVQDYTKIRCIFLQNANTKWQTAMRLYRDLNAKFVKETEKNGTNKLWATNPNLVLQAETYKNDDYNRSFM